MANLRQKNAEKRGFTLIELLIVIGIIGFIAAAILVAVDPVKRIQSSRDSQRWSEVNAILNGLLKWQSDNLETFVGAESTAQEYEATLNNESAGDYALDINGVTSATVAHTGNATTDAASLAAVIDGQTFSGDVINATSSGAVVTLVAAQPGNDYTVVDASTGGPTITVAQTVANILGAPIDTAAGSVQVIVSDANTVQCITGGGNSPTCPAADPALITATTLETECVANIAGLAPDYLAEIPTDPQEGSVPTAGFSAIGESNTGYYINRNASGRITIGSCYPEQENNIRVQR